ncbi:hypothetical protein PLESTF_001740600 [Pleodorina starrii]|nr:hypothetical protein PLESTF_001740600 [Pleodorina starrii]
MTLWGGHRTSASPACISTLQLEVNCASCPCTRGCTAPPKPPSPPSSPPPSPRPPSPAPPPPPPVNHPGGECLCLGHPPIMADPDASLSFPILSANGSLSLGDLHVGLDWIRGERALEVEVNMNEKYFFGYSAGLPTLRLRSSSRLLLCLRAASAPAPAPTAPVTFTAGTTGSSAHAATAATATATAATAVAASAITTTATAASATTTANDRSSACYTNPAITCPATTTADRQSWRHMPVPGPSPRPGRAGRVPVLPHP